MKKIVYLALCLGALTSLDSCNPKAKATTVQTTKRYTEHIVNDDYNAFVKAIKFTEPAAKTLRKPAAKAAAVVRASNVQRRMADSRRNWNRQAVREVRPAAKPAPVQAPAAAPVTKPAPVRKAAAVVKKSYADVLRDDMRAKMTSNDRDWKIRATDNKEVWRAKHARHAGKKTKEAMKFRDNHKRDFLKDIDRGQRRFVKDIMKHRGEKEIIKTLEHGKRNRDVVKVLNEGRREIDKVKRNGKKLMDVKDIDRRDREIIKAKDNYRGNRERFREVFVK